MAATSDCGPTITVPFLEGTVPPRDNVHTEGCFDIVQEVQQDSRRGSEFVDAAKRWADRFVNNELKSKGSPGQIGILGPEKVWLAITPIPGSTVLPGNDLRRGAGDAHANAGRIGRGQPAEAAEARSRPARAIPRSARRPPPFP